MAEQDRIHHHIMKPNAFSGRILSFFSEADTDITPDDIRSDLQVSQLNTDYGNPPSNEFRSRNGSGTTPSRQWVIRFRYTEIYAVFY